jgi:hypothetical protein
MQLVGSTRNEICGRTNGRAANVVYNLRFVTDMQCTINLREFSVLYGKRAETYIVYRKEPNFDFGKEKHDDALRRKVHDAAHVPPQAPVSR